MSQTLDKNQVFESFRKLLVDRKALGSKVITKEQEAERAKDQQILELASTYTVDTIIKGLADLQLDVGSVVGGLAEKLSSEMAKLEQLRRAIQVETQRLQELRQVRVVADALHLLTLEHQEKLMEIDRDTQNQQEILAQEQTETRKLWERDQQEFDIRIQETAALLAQERERQEADFTYQMQREQQIKQDEYAETLRSMQRQLQETGRIKEKDWGEREQELQKNSTLLQEYQQKVEAFPTELEKQVNTAREEAIQEVSRDAKVRAELLDKEWQGTQQGYELKIQSLELTIQRQIEQIESLSNQLQEVMRQSQDLALRAFASSTEVSLSGSNSHS